MYAPVLKRRAQNRAIRSECGMRRVILSFFTQAKITAFFFSILPIYPFILPKISRLLKQATVVVYGLWKGKIQNKGFFLGLSRE